MLFYFVYHTIFHQPPRDPPHFLISYVFVDFLVFATCAYFYDNLTVYIFISACFRRVCGVYFLFNNLTAISIFFHVALVPLQTEHP